MERSLIWSFVGATIIVSCGLAGLIWFPDIMLYITLLLFAALFLLYTIMIIAMIIHSIFKQ